MATITLVVGPVPIADAEVSERTAVAAGNDHSVALKSDGTLWAWGGSLGAGTTAQQSVPTQEHTGATNWSAIAASYHHTVALKSDGTLWAWGDNAFGALGDGTTADKNAPTQESTMATDWTAIGAGAYHTVALKSDCTLWAWGSNNHGQIGAITNGPATVTSPTQELTGADNWSAVAAGTYHSVTIKLDGTVWAWGNNTTGQLGDGTYVGGRTPTQESTGATNWSAIAAELYTVGPKSNGTLWAWGANYSGELGDGTTTRKNTPTQELTQATNWTAIAAGDYEGKHTVALRSDAPSGRGATVTSVNWVPEMRGRACLSKLEQTRFFRTSYQD